MLTKLKIVLKIGEQAMSLELSQIQKNHRHLMDMQFAYEEKLKEYFQFALEEMAKKYNFEFGKTILKMGTGKSYLLSTLEEHLKSKNLVLAFEANNRVMFKGALISEKTGLPSKKHETISNLFSHHDGNNQPCLYGAFQVVNQE